MISILLSSDGYLHNDMFGWILTSYRFCRAQGAPYVMSVLPFLGQGGCAVLLYNIIITVLVTLSLRLAPALQAALSGTRFPFLGRMRCLESVAVVSVCIHPSAVHFIQCCFTSTETVGTNKDGEPKAATSTSHS